MLWTDYCRINEQLSIMKVSILRLKKLLKHGFGDAIENEAAFLKFNYQILLDMKNKYDNEFFDAGILRLENEVGELLEEAYSFSYK